MTPENMIRRPDGSYINLDDLEPRKRLGHDLIRDLFPEAEAEAERLAQLKHRALSEMNAYRDMMMSDYGVKVDGGNGGFALRSICGTMILRLDVSKHTTFGPELEAAKALIDEFLETRLVGSDEVIVAIVEKIFRVNKQGRLDTQGILGLRDHKFDDPLWKRAMDAIEDAICRDSSTTYIRFYRADPERKTETLLPLDLAKA